MGICSNLEYYFGYLRDAGQLAQVAILELTTPQSFATYLAFYTFLALFGLRSDL